MPTSEPLRKVSGALLLSALLRSSVTVLRKFPDQLAAQFLRPDTLAAGSSKSAC